REVMYHLLGRYGIARGLVDVVHEEGVEAILRNLGRWLRRSGLQQLGVIVDVDEDLTSRWRAVRNRLTALEYAGLPRIPSADGVVVKKDDEPTVGVWIMPDNSRKGLLENFLAQLVPTDRLALWKRAGHAVSRIPSAERRFIKEHLPKAHMHTYLAWQEEP